MLFRLNCSRPVYVVRGCDENDRVVATGVSIETMKFDGWRVVG